MTLVDPTAWANLGSLDLGSITSPDGRETPVTAYTNVATIAQAVANAGAGVTHAGNTATSTAPIGSAASGTASAGPFSISLPSLPANFGERVALGTLAIIVIALAIYRLVK